MLLMAVCFSPIGCLLSCFLSRVSAGPRMRLQEPRAGQRGSKVNDGLDGEETGGGGREERRGKKRGMSLNERGELNYSEEKS